MVTHCNPVLPEVFPGGNETRLQDGNLPSLSPCGLQQQYIKYEAYKNHPFVTFLISSKFVLLCYFRGFLLFSNMQKLEVPTFSFAKRKKVNNRGRLKYILMMKSVKENQMYILIFQDKDIFTIIPSPRVKLKVANIFLPYEKRSMHRIKLKVFVLTVLYDR